MKQREHGLAVIAALQRIPRYLAEYLILVFRQQVHPSPQHETGRGGDQQKATQQASEQP